MTTTIDTLLAKGATGQTMRKQVQWLRHFTFPRPIAIQG